MNEEQFTIHDEKELFEELSKDKCKRSDILINLNVALQKYQNIVGNIKGIREIQEYKIAVVTIENELQKVQQKNQQLKEELNKYTDPEDLTLMFMYCDEKAKDKIKCLEQENQQLKEQLESSIGIVKHNMMIQKHVDRERKLQKKIEAKEEEVNMNKNIGDMTESMLKDLIIELQEENSRYERKIDKLELIVEQLKISEKARKEAVELLKILHYNFSDDDSIHYKIQDIEKKLDIDKGE